MSLSSARLFQALFILVAFTTCRSQEANPRNCVSDFYRNESNFDICKTNMCFMFVSQKPYITLPSDRSKMEKKLFRCVEFGKIEKLGGISLNVFKKIVNQTDHSLRNTHCIWAGDDCLFGDLVKFLEDNGGSHQFAIMGFLLEVSSRMTEKLYPSTSLFDDRMVIIGPVVKDGPLDRLKQPFRAKAWYLFISMLIIFLIFGMLVVWAFSPEKFSLITMILHFLGEESSTSDVSAQNSHNGLPDESASTVTSDSDEGNVTPTNRERDALESSMNRNRQAMYKAAVLLWRIALSAFLVILLLFYEVAVVNFLFLEQSTPNNVPVNTLNAESLQKYAVLKNSALEDVWQRTVDPYKEFAPAIPWQRCKTENECFNLVTDKSSVVKYAVTYSAMADYQLRDRKKCSDLTFYSTEKRLYSFGAGWLYGAKVSNTTRRKIDKTILDLRLTDKMRELVQNITKQSGNCSADRGDIEAPIILLPLAVLVGPCLLGLAVVLFISWRRRVRSESEEQPAVATSTDELIDVSVEAHNAAFVANHARDLRRRGGQVR